ncbi:MAG TPA: selenium cofactor biosynthesis protein YqeC [Anaerolineales bacterium]
MSLTLAHALRMGRSSCIAFVGAGGKTTAMVKLAREIKPNVIVTATSHLGLWQTKFAHTHISTDEDSLDIVNHRTQGIILVTGKRERDRLQPVNNKLLNWLYQYCKSRSIPLLIEADGSRQKPLKAWAAHEPPIPNFVDVVIQMAGLDGLGKPLKDELVHRVDIFSNLSGLGNGETISPKAISEILTHVEGGLKNIPKNAKRIVILNKADSLELQAAALAMTPSLLPAYHSVIVASLTNEKVYAVHEPVAGIVLAAGESTRFGKPKQLLDWKGQPFVRAVTLTAIRAGLSPVIVVTGANAEQITSTIRDLKVQIVKNENWKTGQGSSIREGILTLTQPQPDLSQTRNENDVGSAIFLLADQPQIGVSILQALKEKHTEGLHRIVAPMVIDRRGNPVLFDRVTFPDLINIEGDTGGRAIFHKHRIEYLPWHDDGLLLDVDTPEQYQRLVSNEDL